ncbi:MAG: DUF2064 domain-containing protein [Mycobacteriales bacterium]
MTRRCAVLLVSGELASAAAPVVIDATALGRAMVADVAETLHDLSGVDSLVVCPPERESELRPLLWADVPLSVEGPADLRSALAAAAQRGYTEAVVVGHDAPDLPQMILAKMFQALASSPVALAPADGGGAVALGAVLPLSDWLAEWLDHARPALDLPSLAEDLRAAAPRPGSVRVTPGWHRLREPADLRRLDPGLEGWESTRALLSGLRTPGEA